MGLIQAKISEKKQLTSDVIELHFQTEETFNFTPGQFISIRVEDRVPPCIRAYSIASKPSNNNEFFLCIKVVEGGRGSNWLNSKNIGDSVNLIGPNGYFTHQNARKNAIFVATGTGLAPFYSIISYILEKGSEQNITLIFGVRYEESLFYIEEFRQLEEKYQNFKFIYTITRPDENWEGQSGRVTTVLEELEIDGPNTESYICGLNAMVSQVTEIFKTKGLKEEDIHYEKYD